MGLFLLHDLPMTNMGDAMLPTFALLWLAGAAFAAAAVAVHRATGTGGLWMLTASLVAALAITGGVKRDIETGVLLGAIGAGLCAASGVVHRRARAPLSTNPVATLRHQASNAASRSRIFADAALAGGAFAGAMFVVFVVFLLSIAP